jgi:hypothetical protein
MEFRVLVPREARGLPPALVRSYIRARAALSTAQVVLIMHLDSVGDGAGNSSTVHSFKPLKQIMFPEIYRPYFSIPCQ